MCGGNRQALTVWLFFSAKGHMMLHERQRALAVVLSALAVLGGCSQHHCPEDVTMTPVITPRTGWWSDGSWVPLTCEELVEFGRTAMPDPATVDLKLGESEVLERVTGKRVFRVPIPSKHNKLDAPDEDRYCDLAEMGDDYPKTVMDYLRYRIAETTLNSRKDIPMRRYLDYPEGVEEDFDIGEMVVVTKSHIIFFLYPSTIDPDAGF